MWFYVINNFIIDFLLVLLQFAITMVIDCMRRDNGFKPVSVYAILLSHEWVRGWIHTPATSNLLAGWSLPLLLTHWKQHLPSVLTCMLQQKQAFASGWLHWVMGCGTSKVLPKASKKGYVSVVQSLVAFSRSHDDDGDNGKPKKHKEKQQGQWFSTSKNLQPRFNSPQQLLRDGQQRDKGAKYKDKFDPRVTAR